MWRWALKFHLKLDILTVITVGTQVGAEAGAMEEQTVFTRFLPELLQLAFLIEPRANLLRGATIQSGWRPHTLVVNQENAQLGSGSTRI